MAGELSPSPPSSLVPAVLGADAPLNAHLLSTKGIKSTLGTQSHHTLCKAEPSAVPVLGQGPPPSPAPAPLLLWLSHAGASLSQKGLVGGLWPGWNSEAGLSRCSLRGPGRPTLVPTQRLKRGGQPAKLLAQTWVKARGYVMHGPEPAP